MGPWPGCHDLIAFAQHHNLKIGTIADLIAYRLKNDRIIQRGLETTLDSIHGGVYRMIVYVNRMAYAEHVALIKGDLEARRAGSGSRCMR